MRFCYGFVVYSVPPYPQEGNRIEGEGTPYAFGGIFLMLFVRGIVREALWINNKMTDPWTLHNVVWYE